MISELRLDHGSRWLLAVLFGAMAAVGTATAQSNADCLECHGDKARVVVRDGKDVAVPYVAVDDIKESVHRDTTCVDCHVDLQGVTGFPHVAKLQPADCTICHDDSFESIAAFQKSTHGRMLREGKPDAPRCADCHDGHRVLKSTDPKSRTWIGNVPATCSRCHAEGQPIARAEGKGHAELAERYLDRIHGPGIFQQGLKVAPVCTTCHGSHGILPPTDENSPIHKSRVNDGCARCHNDIARVHTGIVAQELWARPGAVPICVDCHQPHAARRVSYQTNMSDAECLRCHADREVVDRSGRPELLVDAARLQGSVHGRHLIACAQCHTQIATDTGGHGCAVAPSRVDCASCHDRQVGLFGRGVHGRKAAEGDAAAPRCIDCHGSHDILESDLPTGVPVESALRERILASPTHRRNIPNLCARCHRADGAVAKRHPDGDIHKLEHYRESIHGKGLLESGLLASANCVDCHTAHMELPPSDPASSVHPEHITETCGRCHDGINEQFRHSIHSPTGNPGFVATADGPHLPHCNDCHSAHSIARTDLAAFRRGIVEQCGKCHERITETYFDTYHGKVTKLGETVGAQCYDCHGSHGIRPASDPASSLHVGNIVGTCATCHPGSQANFATYLTHATHGDRERYPALYWAWIAMSTLLIGVFAFFGLHLLAWLPRSIQLRKEMKRQHAAAAAVAATAATGPQPKQYMRFRRYDRNLHRMVIVSFLGLALTGMTLKFSETAWARVLNAMLGGVVTAGWIHRLCAVVTFAYMGLHLWDLGRRYRKSGKSLVGFFLDPSTTMVPLWRDVKEMFGTFRWFLGLGQRPRYGKWTYWEKFDYFAVFWGVIIIGCSGLILWFPVFFTRFLPGWVINVATIIHSEEALLATGFIFTIHFFNTHLRPEKFPMDPVVFTGRMTVQELEHEKPRLYEELVQKGELDQHLVEPATPVVRRAAYIFGYTALTVGVVLVLLLAYGLITVGL